MSEKSALSRICGLPLKDRLSPAPLRINRRSRVGRFGQAGALVRLLARTGSAFAVCGTLMATDTNFYWDTDGSATGDTISGAHLGGTGTWDLSTANCWDGASASLGLWPNHTTDNAIYAGTAGTVNLGTLTTDGVVFNSDGYVLTGGTLTLDGAAPTITVTGAGTQATIQSNLTLGPNAVLGGAGNLSLGAIDGGAQGFGFTKTGAGVLTIQAAGSYSGPTEVSGGTLQANGDNIFASNSAFMVDNVSGATLDLNGHDQTVGSLSGGGPLGGNVTLGTGTLTVGGNNQTTQYAGQISGSGGLTKIGGSDLTLSSAQTYTGQTNLANGRLFVNSTLASNAVTVGPTGTLGGAGAVSGLVTVNPGGTIQAGATDGTGSLNLSGGLTFLSFGTIDVGQIAGPSPNILNIGTLTGGPFISAITINVITPSLSGYVNGIPYTLFTYTGGAIQGPVGFSAFDLGTVAGTNSRTVPTLNDTGSSVTLTLNADTPKWTGFDANLGQASSRWAALPFVFDWQLINAGSPTAYLEGDTVLFDDSAIGSTTVSINDGDVHPSLVTFNNSAAVPYVIGVLGDANGIAGSTPLVKSNTGIVTIIDSNSFTGGVVLNGGVIQLANDLALGTQNWLTFGPNVAAGTKLQLNGHSITLTGLTSDVNPGSPVVENGAAGVNSTLTLDLETTGGAASGNAHSVFAGVLQNGGTGKLGLTLTGNGSLTLTGTNTYTGPTIISGGTLSLGNGGTSGSIDGTSGITNNSALVFNRSDHFTFNGSVTGSGTTEITGQGTMSLTGTLGSTGGPTIDAATTLRVGNGGTTGAINLTGSITNNGLLDFDRSDGFTFSGTTTGTGITEISGPRIFNLTGMLTSTGGISVDASTTLQLSGAGFMVGGVNLLAASSQLVFNFATSESVFNNISGAGSVTQSNASGTTILGGTNTYTGPTLISGGILRANGDNVFASNSAFTLSNASGATLDLNGHNQQITSLSGGGPLGGNVTLGTAILTVEGNATTQYAGQISGLGGLTKIGSGTLSLASAQTYTGFTTVNGGRLFINSTLASGSVSVGGSGTPGTSGTLGGSGTISGLVSVNSGATIQAGTVDGNGSLTLSGGLTFMNLGTIDVGQIAQASPNILNIGTLTVGSSADTIALNVTTTSSSGYVLGTPYTLFTYTGGSIHGSAGFSAFELGTIAGIDRRTSGTLNDTGSAVTLTLIHDTPKWTGFDVTTGSSSSAWVPNNASVANWQLIQGATATSYIEGDTVLFDDSAFNTTVSPQRGRCASFFGHVQQLRRELRCERVQ